MEIKDMSIEQVETRLAEIKNLIEDPNADLTALENEVQELAQRKADIEKAVEQRNAIANKISAGAGKTTESRSMENNKKMEKNYTIASPEYRSAWLKNVANECKLNLGAMSTEERDAFTHLTTNSSQLVPQPILDRIVDLVESKAPLYNDATKSGLSQGFSVPRRTAIAQGDAAATNEGVANDDEQNTFDLLTLTGVEIKKHVVISRKMKFKSIASFEDFLVREIADRISVAKETQILARLNDTNYGIEDGNVLINVAKTDAAIRNILSKIRGAGVGKIYANTGTIWNILAGIQIDGKPAFLPSAMENPAEVGRVYGYVVVEDNNIDDNKMYVGKPSHILANDYDDLTLQVSTDPKTFEEIIAGYSLFDAGLDNPKSFVSATFVGE